MGMKNEDLMEYDTLKIAIEIVDLPIKTSDFP